MSPALWLWLSSKISYTACASRVFSGAEETTPHEPLSEDDSQEERERKERIPQRKADISRCWSKYCIDLLKTSRDKCVQEVRNGDQGDDDTIAGQGLITLQYYCFYLLLHWFLRPGSEAVLRMSLVEFKLRGWLLNNFFRCRSKFKRGKTRISVKCIIKNYTFGSAHVKNGVWTNGATQCSWSQYWSMFKESYR